MANKILHVRPVGVDYCINCGKHIDDFNFGVDFTVPFIEERIFGYTMCTDIPNGLIYNQNFINAITKIPTIQEALSELDQALGLNEKEVDRSYEHEQETDILKDIYG